MILGLHNGPKSPWSLATWQRVHRCHLKPAVQPWLFDFFWDPKKASKNDLMLVTVKYFCCIWCPKKYLRPLLRASISWEAHRLGLQSLYVFFQALHPNNVILLARSHDSPHPKLLADFFHSSTDHVALMKPSSLRTCMAFDIDWPWLKISRPTYPHCRSCLVT